MPADLAEAAAIILAAEGRFDGATPPLSAPDALDLEAGAGQPHGAPDADRGRDACCRRRLRAWPTHPTDRADRGRWGEVLAVDLQSEMLALVKRRAAHDGLGNVRTLKAGAGDGAIPAGRYDVALLATVLGEVPAERRPAAVHEIAAALRPGGALIVVEAIFDPHRQSRDTVLAGPSLRD